MSDTRLLTTDLYKTCSIDSLGFQTTAELEVLPGIIGQQRAMEAVDFGANIDAEGYNIFIMGPADVGKHTLAKRYLEEHVKKLPCGHDWAYLNNFDDPQKPRAVSLPSGQGAQLRDDIERVIADLLENLPHAFDDEYYRGRMRAIDEAARKHRAKLFGMLQAEADRQGVILLRMQDGSYAFAAKRDGQPLSSEEFERLPTQEREKTEDAIARLHEELQHTLLELREWERNNLKKVEALNEQVALEVISSHINKLKHAYPTSERLQQYFDDMQDDILDNVNAFIKYAESNDDSPAEESALTKRYQINLIVDNADMAGAPLVFEDLPTHQTLLGCVEHMAMMGALVTDFSLIKAGSVHRANGGFLILNVEQLLMQPLAWYGLKRVLQSKESRFETLEKMFSLISTVSLEPEPIPIELKVVLLGDRYLYYLLYEMDPDFARLFKVVADFDEHMPRTAENDMLFARMIATTIVSEALLPMDCGAVARVIEQAARTIDDAEKFSLHVGETTDLLRECSYLASKQQCHIINSDHVELALHNREQRHGRLRQDLYNQIQRQVIQIDTAGDRVGQINALSVIELGGFAFAQPSRVSANCRFGDDSIIDIEREVELSGSIHTKGVLILSGYLGATYSHDGPLCMSASIVFEQNYGEVEGDSATVAELCALLSAIARIPLKQSFAITGSMNQFGDVQAIGGANEKVEGFFDVCKMSGLTGSQGVIIPASNVQHLMLKQEVVDAVEQGIFHIHAISRVEQAIALLTGYDVGELDDDDAYPEGSFNAAVADRLKQWAEIHKHDKQSGEQAEEATD